MIDEVKVTIIQSSSEQVIYDEDAKKRNVENIVSHIRQSDRENNLIVFPELSTTGYIPLSYAPDYKIKMWEFSEDLKNSDTLSEILKATAETNCSCIFGFPEKSKIKYEFFNSAALISQGRLVGVYRKVHLAAEENHYFIPGSKVDVFTSKLGTIGIGICYDMLFPELARILATKGAEIIVFIASIGKWGSLPLWASVFPLARALENQVHVVFCNDVSTVVWKKIVSPHYGKSNIVSSTGKIVAKARTDEKDAISGILTKKDLEKGVSPLPVFRDRRQHIYASLTEPYDEKLI